MDFLTVSFLLSLFMATQATDLSSELDQPPLDESIYIFMVKSDASINEIKASFNMTGRPRHSFRAIGENTYYFVLASNSTTALRQLTFPAGSAVIQYPVVHIYDYFKMFGVEYGYQENDTEEVLPDITLVVVEKDFNVPKGTPVKLFDIMILGTANEWKEAHQNIACAVYMAIAYYPTKLIYFAAFDDNAMQHIFKDEQDVYGGIGVMTSTIKHVVKIKM